MVKRHKFNFNKASTQHNNKSSKKLFNHPLKILNKCLLYIVVDILIIFLQQQ